jgi:hypothetical protein
VIILKPRNGGDSPQHQGDVRWVKQHTSMGRERYVLCLNEKNELMKMKFHLSTPGHIMMLAVEAWLSKCIEGGREQQSEVQ